MFPLPFDFLLFPVLSCVFEEPFPFLQKTPSFGTAKFFTMIHVPKIYLPLIGLVALVASSCSVTSHSEMAAGVRFDQYKTFGWNEVPGTNHANGNDIIDNNIKMAIASELEAKGWVPATNPDVVLDYTIAVTKEQRTASDPVYSTPFTRYVYGGRGRVYSLYSPSMLMGYHTYNVPFREGELTVNMVDPKTNKLVWQGWATGQINTPQVTTQEMNKEVHSIFKRFQFPAHG